MYSTGFYIYLQITCIGRYFHTTSLLKQPCGRSFLFHKKCMSEMATGLPALRVMLPRNNQSLSLLIMTVIRRFKEAA